MKKTISSVSDKDSKQAGCKKTEKVRLNASRNGNDGYYCVQKKGDILIIFGKRKIQRWVPGVRKELHTVKMTDLAFTW